MDYVTKAIEVTQNILHDDYYTNRFFGSLERHKMTVEGIEAKQYTAQQLISLFNTFWAVLPDSFSIRGFIFSQVCEIAEGMFEYPDGPDELNPVSTDQYAEMHKLADS